MQAIVHPYQKQILSPLTLSLSKSTSMTFIGDSRDFKDIQTLESISLSLQDVQTIKQHCKHIKSVKLRDSTPSNTDCSNAILDSLSGIQTLRQLQYYQVQTLTLQTMKKLSKLQKLLILNLYLVNTNNYLEQILQNLPNLKSIGKFNYLSEEAFHLLKKYPNVEELFIRKLQDYLENKQYIREAMISFVSNLSHLTGIIMKNCFIRDQHLEIISEHIATLKCLEICKRNDVTMKGFQCLVKYSQSLQRLNIALSYSIHSNQFPDFIKNFKKLKYFRAPLDLLSNEALFQISENMQKLETFIMTNILLSNFIPPNMNDFIVKMPQLKHLEIYSFFNHFTLKLLIQNLKQLKVLSLICQYFRYSYGQNKQIGDKECFMIVKNLHKLWNLNLTENDVGDKGFMKIMINMRRLVSNFLGNTGIGERAKRNAMLLQGRSQVKVSFND